MTYTVLSVNVDHCKLFWRISRHVFPIGAWTGHGKMRVLRCGKMSYSQRYLFNANHDPNHNAS